MCDLYQSVDVLKFASQVLGMTKSIKINSNIKNCSDYQEKIYKEDYYKIRASHDNPITLDKIILIFEKMKQQGEIDTDEGGSYVYEGFDYNKRLGIWEIHWNTY